VRSELTCAAARVDLSARLDGELDPRASEDLDRHLRTCPHCRAHEQALGRVRRALRAQPADEVPDLAPEILARIPVPAGRSAVWAARARVATVAALVAAVVFAGSSLLTTPRPPDSAAADDITRGVRGAARSLERYRASYSIVERGWHPVVPVRRFTAEIAFRAPEDFRLTLRDRTAYPDPRRWPVNNVDLVTSSRRLWIREPHTCPTRSLPACAPPGTRETTVVHRQPFDGASDLPSDIIVPLETLAASEGFEVIEVERIAGRTAHHVSLAYRHALPLVRSLQQGGSWRSFRPSDRVDLWIDARTWLPLHFEVRRSPRGKALLVVNATSFQIPPRLPHRLFNAPRGGVVRSGGWRATPPPGPRPWIPRQTAGLAPYRFGVTPQGQKVASYAEGMTWLKVTHERWSRSFVGQLRTAERVKLSPSRVGYYEPAGDTARRRVDLYGPRAHIFLESNLQRAALVDVARSVPAAGSPLPERVRALGGLVIRQIPVSALSEFAFAELPSWVPPGYKIVSSSLARGRGRRTLSIHIQAREGDYGGAGIEITQSPSVPFLPPSFEELRPVTIDGQRGRWSRARGEVEWMEDGVYRAVRAPSLGRATTLAIARGMR
jgi:putative zinc finger protein